MRKAFIATLALVLAGFAGSASAQTVVNADITTNTTWSGTIILQKPIFVKSGARLTILAGTIVRGQPRTAAVQAGSQVGTPGALIVTQTGRVIANGTSTNPIIFTTAATDNDNDGIADDADNNGFDDPWNAGDVFLDDDPLNAPLAPLDKAGLANVSKWGGVVLLGNAPTNLSNDCGVAYGKCTIEGLTIPGFSVVDSTFGGVQPHDSSGSLQYVSIRHGGDEIGLGNELNCLSLGGVGDGTILDHVECYANFDDGFEWFGGTVDGKHLATFMVGDDQFDLDQGYTGVLQFLFGIMPFFNENGGGAYGSASGDKGGEWDGDDRGELAQNANIRIDRNSVVSDPTCWPFSNPSVWNLTMIGSTPPAGQCFTPVSPVTNTGRIQMRNGFAGNLFNSIVVNTGTQAGVDIDPTVGAGCTDSITHVNNGLIAVVSTTLDDTGTLAAEENTAIANGNAVAASLGGTANVVNNALFPGLLQEDVTFDPTGNAAGKLSASLLCAAGPINPRPGAGIVGIAGGVPQGSPGAGISHLDTATYRGAFDRTATTLWTTGWTTLNRAGLLADLAACRLAPVRPPGRAGGPEPLSPESEATETGIASHDARNAEEG